TITGPGAGRLTVQRSTDALEFFRIFHIPTSTVTVFISGLTISNGSVVGEERPGGGDANGGGIRSSGVLTLTDCTISANRASGSNFLGGNGGGVLNENGTMIITRCTISNNSASASANPTEPAYSDGGGILNYSGGSLTITNSTISGNSCSGFSQIAG